MRKLAKVILTVGCGLFIYDVYLMATGKSEPNEGVNFPNPISLAAIGTGLVFLVLGRKKDDCDCDFECDYDCFECTDQDDCINF